MRTSNIQVSPRSLTGLTRFFTASLAISLMAIAWASTAVAAPGDSVSGSGTYRKWTSADGIERLSSFSFSATGGPGTTATGTMTFSDHHDTITATVRCLTVDGNKGAVLGEITASNETVGMTKPGNAIYFYFTDAGTPGSGIDRFDQGWGEDNFTYGCQHFEGRLIRTGEITVNDASDNCPGVTNFDQSDQDSDGLGDACDPVDDRDSDGDGVNDTADNCRTVSNPDQANNDGDAVGDLCDPDDDNDAVADGLDAFPLDPAESADADRDGVGNNRDNCPTVANANQMDSDSDKIGDTCDPIDNRDPDADGLNNTGDNCPTVANPAQKDIDADGIGDACDPTDDRTAAQQLADLITQLQTAPAGPGNSYMAKLQGIADSVAEGDTKGACSRLNAFENEVRAQTGKKLTQSDAAALLGESAAIKTKAGCS